MDLGNLQLEEAFQQSRMGSGNEDLGSFRCLAHFSDVYLKPYAVGIGLVGNLLRRQEQCFYFAQIHQDVSVFPPLDDAGDNVSFSVAIFLIDQGPLSFPDPLDDHLLGCLRSDPSEIRRCDFDLDDISHLVLGIDGLGFF